MTHGNRIFLGFCVGAWMGAVGAALVCVAIDTGFESQTLAGGHHLTQRAIVIAVAAISIVSGLFGGSFGNVWHGRERRAPGPSE